MRCEVCGNEIRGQPFYKVIERGRMTVCARCTRYGSKDWNPNQPLNVRIRRPRMRRPRSEVVEAEILELVESYGNKVRKARQKTGMTVEEFAKMIKEKESVVKKLEKEELNPDIKLVRKIKNALNLELLVVEETTSKRVVSKPKVSRTLADIMKMSQSKKEEPK